MFRGDPARPPRLGSSLDSRIHGDGIVAIVSRVIERLTDEARALLESDAVATVVTINADGSPHVSSAWVGLDGEEIVSATLPISASCATCAVTRASRCQSRVSASTSGVCESTWSSRARRASPRAAARRSSSILPTPTSGPT